MASTSGGPAAVVAAFLLGVAVACGGPGGGSEARDGVGREVRPEAMPSGKKASAPSSAPAAADGQETPASDTADEPPFDPLGYPDWFTARSRFPHAKLLTVIDEEGTLQGVRVLAVRPGLRPANLTLQPGDLLLRINGVSLTDTAHVDRVEEIVAWTFLRADRMNVRVRRDGKEFNLVELAPVTADED